MIRSLDFILIEKGVLGELRIEMWYDPAEVLRGSLYAKYALVGNQLQGCSLGHTGFLGPTDHS